MWKYQIEAIYRCIYGDQVVVIVWWGPGVAGTGSMGRPLDTFTTVIYSRR